MTNTLTQKRLNGELRIQQPRTPLAERVLPVYSRGEEVFNMVTHIVGGALALAALVLMIVKTSTEHNTLGLISGIIYGLSMILVYTISSVYHGLDPKSESLGKKTLQILDHCDIYCLVAGTYTPVALAEMRVLHPALAYSTLGIFYGVCILGTVFTGIDMHKFSALSYTCYFVAGWSALAALKVLVEMYSWEFVILFVLGGVLYSSGMIFFVLQQKHRYCHSIFHIFIILGSLLQFLPIYWYCL